MTKEFMLDTNIFDEVVDGNIKISELQECDATFYITPIQRAELKNAGGERANKLLDIFNQVSDEERNSILAYDTEGAGYGDGAYASQAQNEIFDKVAEEHAPGEGEDVNISTVSISEGITFVTADKRLQNALERTYPDSYLTREEFIFKLNNDKI
ncbi:hypothetical protein V5735_01640 (plasmid) [Haladaptatus sp. SPP-AMP-3]|uniref:hypothetical protein n=1 Tax=Haladaptatus sp. SPP-AMP-3 TaxID=3121295 RepID=UPI003C30150D